MKLCTKINHCNDGLSLPSVVTGVGLPPPCCLPVLRKGCGGRRGEGPAAHAHPPTCRSAATRHTLDPLSLAEAAWIARDHHVARLAAENLAAKVAGTVVRARRTRFGGSPPPAPRANQAIPQATESGQIFLGKHAAGPVKFPSGEPSPRPSERECPGTEMQGP